MARKSQLSRRQALTVIGAGTAAALAGCSGGEDGDSAGENGPEDTTEQTETEPRFATEGNDSELIEISDEELALLTVSDLPEEDWQVASESSTKISFERELDQGVRSGIEATAYVLESVSQAKSDYSGFINEYTSGRYENTRSLQIGVESDVLQYSQETNKQTWVSFRDANAIGTIVWATGTTSTDGPSVPQPSWKETAEIAATLHKKWR